MRKGDPSGDQDVPTTTGVEPTENAARQPNDPDMNLRTGYDQLCETYRAVDDFRSKLLGFLPAVTGGGLLLLGGEKGRLPENLFLPVGLFGVIVALGFFSYEIYGIEKCHALITSGTTLEVALGLDATGQFKTRPRAVRGHVNEPFAAAIIYPAVMAAWAYFAVLHVAKWMSPILAAVIFGITCGLTLRYNRRLGEDAESAASKGGQAADLVG
jgi:hypothetical protein